MNAGLPKGLRSVGSPGVPPERKVLGLTGNPGAGKSTVAQWLRKAGARVIDADAWGHELLRHESPVYDALLLEFGKSVLNETGDFDRRRLGAIVFSSPKRLQKLNYIVHPALLRRLDDCIQQFRTAKIKGPLVIDAALIYEWEIADRFDAILAVASPRELRKQRFLQSRNLSAEDFDRREASQLPEADKIRMADIVFCNEGDLEALHCQIDRFMTR